MKKLTKSQRQLIMLGVLMAAIVAVLAIFVFKPPQVQVTTYVPRSVDTGVPDAVLKHPAYRGLSSPVDLPLSPGQTGRDNPFEPY